MTNVATWSQVNSVGKFGMVIVGSIAGVTGIVIVSLMMYTLAFEPLLTLFLANFPEDLTKYTALPKIFSAVANLESVARVVDRHIIIHW